jgi:hypothetical protein
MGEVKSTPPTRSKNIRQRFFVQIFSAPKSIQKSTPSNHLSALSRSSTTEMDRHYQVGSFSCMIDDDQRIFLLISNNVEFGKKTSNMFTVIDVFTLVLPSNVARFTELYAPLGFSDKETAQNILTKAGYIFVDGNVLEDRFVFGQLGDLLGSCCDPQGGAPTLVFVGRPHGGEYELMSELLKSNGFDVKELLVMNSVGDGIVFEVDVVAPGWCQESSEQIQARLLAGIASEVAVSCVVKSGNFVLGTMKRKYSLHLVGNGRISRSGVVFGDYDLVSLNISDSTITVLSNDLFRACFNLRFVSLPAGLTSIKDFGFLFCESLTSVDLAACQSLTTIGKCVFQGCIALFQVFLPASIVSVEDLAFSHTGVRLFDCRACPSARFPMPVLKASLVEKIATSLPDSESLRLSGPNLAEGTCVESFTCAMGASPSEPTALSALGALMEVSGSRSIRLMWSEFSCTLADEVNIRALPSVALTSTPSLNLRRPSRVIVTGLRFPQEAHQQVFSSCLRDLSPGALQGIMFKTIFPALRDLTLPAGLVTIPKELCGSLFRLRRMLLSTPASLKTIDDRAFRDCTSLQSFRVPATVTAIECFAFAGSGIRRLDLLDLSLAVCEVSHMTRLEYLAAANACFTGAASLRSLTFGRISCERAVKCGGHPISVRCIAMNGRFPRSLEQVVRSARVFGELAMVAGRVVMPAVPP